MPLIFRTLILLCLFISSQSLAMLHGYGEEHHDLAEPPHCQSLFHSIDNELASYADSGFFRSEECSAADQTSFTSRLGQRTPSRSIRAPPLSRC